MSESERQAEGAQRETARQARGGGRRIAWGFPHGLVVSGVLFGASGETRKQFLLSLAAVAALVGTSNTINVFTILHDRPQYELVEPIILEGSSWATIVMSVWIPWLAYRTAEPQSRPLWWIAAIHIAGALAFSLAHVAGFVFIRQAAYWAIGSHYGYEPLTSDFLYEFRKDALSYVVIIAIFWGVGRFLRSESPGQPAPIALPAMFDIRDGARLTRVRIDDILAVTSADNYVEFVLRDGRRLMMRKALSAIESELGPRGFLRTHRSWLINACQMTALKPEGSGDYSVELGTLSVPLSRRFPDALAKLRAG